MGHNDTSCVQEFFVANCRSCRGTLVEHRIGNLLHEGMSAFGLSFTDMQQGRSVVEPIDGGSPTLALYTAKAVSPNSSVDLTSRQISPR